MVRGVSLTSNIVTCSLVAVLHGESGISLVTCSFQTISCRRRREG